MNVQPFLFGDGWIEVRDGNDSVRHIFDQHYSRYVYADGRKPKLFVGPGEKLVLMTPCARAIFAWRKFRSGDGQRGVNCMIFRNDGAGRSSDLISAADELADERWPGERHFTYVNPRKIKSVNPGYCFKQAGCGLPAETISEAVSKAIGGGVKGLSTKWRPSPAELGAIARGMDLATETTHQRGQLWAYRSPRSKIIGRRVPKADMRAAVDNDRFPRGSIWMPALDRNGKTLPIGDVFAPDPTWSPPVAWPPPKNLPDEAAEPTSQLGIDWAQLAESKRLDLQAEPPSPAQKDLDAKPPPPPRSNDEILAELQAKAGDKIEVTPTLLKSLGFTG